MKVLVIGAGNMGLTYAEGMSKSKLLKKKNIMVLDKSEEKLEELNQISHFDAFKELEDCVPKTTTNYYFYNGGCYYKHH